MRIKKVARRQGALDPSKCLGTDLAEKVLPSTQKKRKTTMVSSMPSGCEFWWGLALPACEPPECLENRQSTPCIGNCSPLCFPYDQQKNTCFYSVWRKQCACTAYVYHDKVLKTLDFLMRLRENHVRIKMPVSECFEKRQSTHCICSLSRCCFPSRWTR